VSALTGAAIDHYRTALSDPALATELDKTVSTLIGDGAELSKPTRTLLPSGFPPTAPAARFAVRDGFHVVRRFPHPEALGTAQFVTQCWKPRSPPHGRRSKTESRSGAARVTRPPLAKSTIASHELVGVMSDFMPPRAGEVLVIDCGRPELVQDR
jgi:hypothetical protein